MPDGDRERSRPRSRRPVALLSAAALCAVSAIAGNVRADLVADQTPFHAYRGLWVDRFDFNGAASISTVFTRAADLGVTDVMFQVRGRADAYYFDNDGLEVHAPGVSSAYDPLALAIAAGQARGIKVHAWINAMPLWQGTSAAPPAHLINTDPDYWIRNAAGNPQPLNSGYVIVNPARQDVQHHIAAVARTIATNYDVAGVHLDYIRLYHANPGFNNVLEYPADAATVTLFQQSFPGQTPTSNPANYKAWMASRITDLVRSIRTNVKDVRPEAQLTAAVWRSSAIGLDSYQQDWARWVDAGLLDAAMPMIYREGFATNDPGDIYRTDVNSGLNLRKSAGVMVGLGTYLQNDDYATAYANVTNQLEYAKAQGANGIQLFDYGALFNGSAAQNGALQAIRDFVAVNRTAPAVAPIADFESGEGVFRWDVTFSGSNQNVASGSAERVTDEHRGGDGAGGASQRLEINKAAGAASFLARHVAGERVAGDYGSNPNFASIGSVGVWLKTTSDDLQVAFGVDDTTTGDRGYFQNVIADGQWHRYEWFLDDPTHWDPWPAVGGDGRVANRFALDSLHLVGTANTNVLWLDDVYHDAAAVAANQWTNNANGVPLTWSHAGNWTGGAPNGAGATANLLRRITANRTITLDAPVTLGTLNFNNASRYTLSGAALTLDASPGANAAINVLNRGSHVVSAPLALSDDADVFVDRGSTLTLSGALGNGSARTITKRGAGMLSISGAQTHGAGGAALVALDGTINLSTDAGRAATGPRLAVTARHAGTRVNFGATQHLLELSILDGATASMTAGGTRRLVTGGLTIDAGARLELNEHDLLVDFAPGDGSVFDRVRAYIVAGYNTGTGGIVSAGGAGPGYNILAPVNNTTFGRDDWAGESIDASTVIGHYVLFGDVNFDGQVDAADYHIAEANIGRSGAQWFHGDVNLDGYVTEYDFVALDVNLGKGTSDPASYDPLREQMVAVHALAYGDWYVPTFEDAQVNGYQLTAVPEPVTLAPAALLLTALAARRRRRRRRRCGR